MTAHLHPDADITRVIDFYEKLSPTTVNRLVRVYSPDASFKDPFNDVQGIDAIRRILERMFESLDDVRFEIGDAVREGSHGFLTWNMTFRLRSKPHRAQRIHGASHLVFDEHGKVARHRDYWDAGEEVYEKVPLLGSVLRVIKRRIG
jgi:steroid delta-isomerase